MEELTPPRVTFVLCTDRTLSIAREIASDDPRIKVIQHDRNLGVGQSIITGK